MEPGAGGERLGFAIIGVGRSGIAVCGNCFRTERMCWRWTVRSGRWMNFVRWSPAWRPALSTAPTKSPAGSGGARDGHRRGGDQ